MGKGNLIFGIFGAALALLAAAPCFSPTARASSAVQGTVCETTSAGGAKERCAALSHMPGGVCTDSDRAKEAEFCSIDFYGKAHALCPKVFSTSPGTPVYDLAGGPYAGNPQSFEAQACRAGGIDKNTAAGDPMSWKMSVNSRETSATLSNASLIYYRFARYFDATAHVPPAVFRSMDRREHNRRVSSRGVKLSAGSQALKMNHAAWMAPDAAERDPSSYKPSGELLPPRASFTARCFTRRAGGTARR